MTGPKHLWSGDWARESEEAAAEAAPPARTAPVRAPAPPRPEPVRAEAPPRPAAPSTAPPAPPRATAPERPWQTARRAGTGALLVLALIAVAGVAIASGVFDRGANATASATSAGPSNPSPTPAFAPARPWMGLTTTSSAAQPGALVTGVTPGGPADQAGLRGGDVILAVNAHPITGPADIGGVIDALPTGSEVLLQIERGGQLSTVGVTLAPKPAGTP